MPLLLLLLLTGSTICQEGCPPCVVVDPIVADQPDELSGVYQFFGEDPECPGGCSYTREGLIYCMGPGPRTGAEECPATSSSSSPSPSPTLDTTSGTIETTTGASTSEASTTSGATSGSTTFVASTTPGLPSSSGASTSSSVSSTSGTSTTSPGTSTTSNFVSTSGASTTTSLSTSSGTSPTSSASTTSGESTTFGASTTTGVSSTMTTTASPTSKVPTTSGVSSTSGASTTSGTSTTSGVSSTTTGVATTSGESTTSSASTTTGASTTSSSDTTSASEPCEEGWSKSGSQCYKLVKTKVNYPTAVDACAAYGEGGLLAAPNAAEVLDLLHSTLNSDQVDDFWVGIDDIDEEGVFRFSDGTTFTKTGGEYGSDDITWSADFTAWKSGQPKADATSRGNQDCVRVDTNGFWDEMHCTNNVKNYACQIPAGNKVQPVCEEGWTMVENLCFRMESATVDYSTASEACASLAENGILAAPKSEAILNLLTTLNTDAVDFWVGLDDRATEGTYTFSDGTSFTLTGGTIGTSDATWSTGFTAWKDGQPKDDAAKQEKQDCVKVTNSAWDDVDCSNTMSAFACQKILA